VRAECLLCVSAGGSSLTATDCAALRDTKRDEEAVLKIVKKANRETMKRLHPDKWDAGARSDEAERARRMAHIYRFQDAVECLGKSLKQSRHRRG
jgi:hypothetical protein